ncbi:MAG TPA: phage shock protein operon transcriptional activator [Myxococcota bacterium]|nr:phage shock protein operon transcriptional activator [Myxococcota bacterium]
MTGEVTRETREAIGRSDAFIAFQQQLSRVAPVERPVLIIGERGTGKELASTRLHFLSRRWGAPLVTLNCAAMTATLISTELFGHEAGAFTGAHSRRIGRFEAAHRGTLFLDEIGNIPIEAQEKILRVVEYGSFERVGGSQSVNVDVRIIGATHQDLHARSREGRFMSDLLDRLSFDVLFLPPLRERVGDIELLAGHFASQMARELERPQIPSFAPEALDNLRAHAWPGNIRELKNVVERAVYRTEGAVITEIDFDPFCSPYAPTLEIEHERLQAEPVPAKSLPEAIRRLEISKLEEALARAHFNQRRAADLMGLSYHQFRGLYRKHRERLQYPHDRAPADMKRGGPR